MAVGGGQSRTGEGHLFLFLFFPVKSRCCGSVELHFLLCHHVLLFFPYTHVKSILPKHQCNCSFHELLFLLGGSLISAASVASVGSQPSHVRPNDQRGLRYTATRTGSHFRELFEHPLRRVAHIALFCPQPCVIWSGSYPAPSSRSSKLAIVLGKVGFCLAFQGRPLHKLGARPHI